MDSSKNLKTIKTVLIGDYAVGKTSLAKRMFFNTFNEDDKEEIIGWLKIELDDADCKWEFQIWDTGSQEKYHTMTSSYYRNAKVVVLVYDITNKTSFENVAIWLAECTDKTNNDPEVMYILIGNKLDLSSMRAVPYDVAENYAKQKGFMFMEVSVKTCENIVELLSKIESHADVTDTQSSNEKSKCIIL